MSRKIELEPLPSFSDAVKDSAREIIAARATEKEAIEKLSRMYPQYDRDHIGTELRAVVMVFSH